MSKTKYISKSDLCGLNDMYDAIIVGSDQIWSNITQDKKIDTAFLLDFLTDNTTKIAYAASMGMVCDNNRDVFEKYLPSFSAISVREEDACAFLEKFLQEKLVCVLDPVFLKPQMFYEEIQQVENKNSVNKTIFLYALEYSEKLLEFVNNLINEIGNDYCIIYYSRKKLKFNCKSKRLIYIAPDNFLYYIKNSDIIVTNSFHGTAFSIIYEKEFYSVLHTKTGSRISLLLKKLEMSDRIVDEPFVQRKAIDWNKVHERLKKEIISSKRFLNEVLN